MFFCLSLVSLLLSIAAPASGHGRLMDPPSRSSMWRVGFDTPENYNDNSLFCGGFGNQYGLYDGKCGICGDPYQGPRENEAGGKYATGVISRVYKQGQDIDVTVEVTANHLGWFEFKICPHNDPKTEASQECLDRHVLHLSDGSGTRYYIGASTGFITTRLTLPREVTCSQCVLQWRWHTGNSWGVDPDGTQGSGRGPQEEFYGCADVGITPASGSEGTTPLPTPTSTAATQRTTPPPKDKSTCVAVSPMWRGLSQMDEWCDHNCRAMQYCPLGLCACP